jgi:hypothetical protein
VRAVVCAGAVVRRDRSAVDQFVCPGGDAGSTSPVRNSKDRKKALRDALAARAQRQASRAAAVV